jgi:hypothetical protein
MPLSRSASPVAVGHFSFPHSVMRHDGMTMAFRNATKAIVSVDWKGKFTIFCERKIERHLTSSGASWT